MTEVQILRRKLFDTVHAIGQRINDRVSERRGKAKCAVVASSCLNWTREDWQEYHAELRPIIAEIRAKGGNPWDASIDDDPAEHDGARD